jgi:preprotein translocase subunit SecD
VKGFGVTLTIGICVSMFTALVVTRLIFDFLLGRGWLTS